MRLDAFLKLTTTGTTLEPGETTDGLFSTASEKPIEILWFEQIATRGRYENRGLGMMHANQGAHGKQLSWISVIKPLDQSSPLLFKALCSPSDDDIVYEEGAIEAYFNKGNSADNPTDWTREPYFAIHMTKVRIMRIQLTADPRVMSMGGGVSEVYYQLPEDLAAMGPLEIIDLGFETVAWSYLGERNTAGTFTSD